MTIHHDKPVGVDIFYREIFAGDTVRDADGKEYTIDERGWARPLDGGSGCGFKRLKDPSFVKGAEKPDPRFREDGSGKIQPAPVSVQKPAPAQEPEKKPAPSITGGRFNRSGWTQFGSVGRRFGLSNRDVFDLLTANGVHVESILIGKQKRRCFRFEDKGKVMELLQAASGIEPPHNGNNGNHRPNASGCVTFANLARALKRKTYVLRRLAEANGFDIIRCDDARNRNDGIRLEDEDRFRELAAGIATPVQVEVPLPAHLSPELTDAIKAGTLHEKIKIVTRDPERTFGKEDAFLILTDQDLADELRRRGFQLTAVKRIEL